jgi:hypothetical protein
MRKNTHTDNFNEKIIIAKKVIMSFAKKSKTVMAVKYTRIPENNTPI